MAAVAAAGRGLSTDDVSAATLRSWDALDAKYDTLPTLRRQADDQAGLPAAFADRYAGLTDSTIDVSARLARDVDDRSLSDAMLGIVNLRREQAAARRRGHDRDAVPRDGIVDAAQRLDHRDRRAGRRAARRSSPARRPRQRAAFEQSRTDLADDPFRAAAGNVPSRVPEGRGHA